MIEEQNDMTVVKARVCWVQGVRETLGVARGFEVRERVLVTTETNSG